MRKRFHPSGNVTVCPSHVMRDYAHGPDLAFISGSRPPLIWSAPFEERNQLVIN